MDDGVVCDSAAACVTLLKRLRKASTSMGFATTDDDATDDNKDDAVLTGAEVVVVVAVAVVVGTTVGVVVGCVANVTVGTIGSVVVLGFVDKVVTTELLVEVGAGAVKVLPVYVGAT